MATRNRASVTKAEIAELNAGVRAARDLTENLVTDFAALLKAACPGADCGDLRRAGREGVGIVARMRLGAAAIAAHGPARFVGHPSDVVRGWACYALVCEEGLGFGERLERVRPFAADAHFGVREWAWMSLRPAVAESLREAIERLTPWTRDSDPFIRRFAAEVTRPRGVWCAHLTPLKRDPAPGLVLLEPLRADGVKYVQDSVANWLNDASKSQPEWVRRVVGRWARESASAATGRICARALRTVGSEPVAAEPTMGAVALVSSKAESPRKARQPGKRSAKPMSRAVSPRGSRPRKT